ncbi:hypothetical protein ACWDKQ_00110 [Saccharopolyspora sp. NPDC000995]
MNDGVTQPARAVVAGLYGVDAADINSATAWAQKVPTARYGNDDVPLGRIRQLKRSRPGAGRSW